MNLPTIGPAMINSPEPEISTIATFPPGFLLGNIVALHDDTLLVAVANRKCIYALPPAVTEGHSRQPYLLHQFENDAWAFGLTTTPQDPRVVYILTTDYTLQGRCVHHLHALEVYNIAAGSHPKILVQFPLSAKGLNGLTALSKNTLLAADCFAGRIWRIELIFTNTDRPLRANVTEWMAHPWFEGVLALPEIRPGIHGLKYSHKLQALCFSNTHQQLFGTIPVNAETLDPDGPVRILIHGPQGDDVLVDDHSPNGPVAYLATHRENSILRIPLQTSPTLGTFEVVAAATEPDSQLLGPTSGTWKWGQEGKTAYFNCDGGLRNPLPGEPPRHARVLQIDLSS